jgi:hypothetical protein
MSLDESAKLDGRIPRYILAYHSAFQNQSWLQRLYYVHGITGPFIYLNDIEKYTLSAWLFQDSAYWDDEAASFAAYAVIMATQNFFLLPTLLCAGYPAL